MGNCFTQLEINKSNNKNKPENSIYLNKNINYHFIISNIIDKKKNIVVGIWNNLNKTNTMGCQGIRIGSDKKIYELKFAIINKDLNMAIFNFENNIKLKILKNKNNISFYEFKDSNNNYTEEINNNTIKNIKKLSNYYNKNDDLDIMLDIIK